MNEGYGVRRDGEPIALRDQDRARSRVVGPAVKELIADDFDHAAQTGWHPESATALARWVRALPNTDSRLLLLASFHDFSPQKILGDYFDTVGCIPELTVAGAFPLNGIAPDDVVGLDHVFSLILLDALAFQLYYPA